MIILISAIILLGIVTYYFHRLDLKKQVENCLLYTSDAADEYAWKGIEPDSYTPEQIELFREIFYTLRPEDVPGWVRSLQLRQIAVPESLRDEILLVVNEQRTIDK